MEIEIERFQCLFRGKKSIDVCFRQFRKKELMPDKFFYEWFCECDEMEFHTEENCSNCVDRTEGCFMLKKMFLMAKFLSNEGVVREYWNLRGRKKRVFGEMVMMNRDINLIEFSSPVGYCITGHHRICPGGMKIVWTIRYDYVNGSSQYIGEWINGKLLMSNSSPDLVNCLYERFDVGKFWIPAIKLNF